jgi:cellulose synthase (UDP-forming)
MATDLDINASGALKMLRPACLIVPAVALTYFVTLSLDWTQQLFLSITLIVAVLFADRFFKNYAATLVVVGVSIFSSARYIFYRVSSTFGFGAESGPQPHTIDMIFMLILLAAELYSFLILLLGYFQTIRPLSRKPAPLPDNPAEWPSVDVFIPTYNEPLSVVRYTVWAAMNMDWPAGQCNVYILDDGHREEFREFAAEAGCGYIVRKNNDHAKAGNINHALTITKGEFIVIFDCDHVPTRSFLQMVMGWFRKDERLGMLQTPHHFYSPDPFERNLKQFRKIPNEGELFYGLVQDGNDLWNATFFCGSCAALRRSAIEEIDGIAVETVTEDAHTSLRMQFRGWNTAYINIPQAAGLATESLSSHVGQRIRWARGMIQILRLDNPLTHRGLRPAQRICYFNAMIHFLYAIPRLIFLTSPLIYLLFGHRNIRGYSLTIMAYALPHIVLSCVSNSRIQGKYRYSFWNEVYEAVLAPYILFPTMMALVNPRLGKFNVTAKGGLVPESYFDRRIALPYVFLLFLNLAGLLMAIPNILWWGSSHPGTVIMNMVWTLYNIVILGVSCAVAYETKQERVSVRVSLQSPVGLQFDDGRKLQGETMDISNGGLAVRIPRGMDVRANENVSVSFTLRAARAELPATVVGNEKGRLRLQFGALNSVQEEDLTRILYSRADSWLTYADQREQDRPLRSLFLLMRLSVRGIGLALRNLLPDSEPGEAITDEKESLSPERTAATGTALLILIGLSLFAPSARAARNEAPKTVSTENASAQNQASFQLTRDFASLGNKRPILLKGTRSSYTLAFTLPSSEVVSSAVLELRYRLAAQLEEQVSQLKLSINGADAGLVSLAHASDEGSDAEVDVAIPAELLVSSNTLEIDLFGVCKTGCATGNLATIVEPTSQLNLSGVRLMLASDLKLLPAPFFDSAMRNAPIAFAFPSTPDAKTLEAAGIVASWFGVRADFRGVFFPVSLNHIPKDNAVLVATAGDLPPSLDLARVQKPTIAIRANPSDPYSKVLVVTGANDVQLLEAARALALGPVLPTGDAIEPAPPNLAPRKANDAPRWLPSERIVSFGDSFTPDQLRISGFGSVNLPFRLAPDLYFGDRGSIPARLSLRVDGLGPGQSTRLGVLLNSTPVATSFISGDGSLIQHITVALPISALQPYRNNLILDWKPDQSAPSAVVPELHVMRNSTFDFGGISHFLDMPKLERLAEAGYPFTRYADLSQTAVVIADSNSPGQIGAYLDLMGYFAAQTGYPGVGVTVVPPSAIGSLVDKDLILLGSFSNTAMLDGFGNRFPLHIWNGTVRINGSTWWMDLQRSTWNLKGRSRQSIEDLLEADPGPQGLIVGLQSPVQNDRGAVVILGKDDDAMDLLATQLVDIDRSGAIYGSLSVLDDSRFESLYLSRDLYEIGTLPRYQQVNFWFLRRFYLLPLFILACCALPIVWLRPWLDQRVALRLKGGANA